MSDASRKTPRLRIAALISAVLLVVAPIAPAFAATYTLSGEVNLAGTLYQYGTYRYKASGTTQAYTNVTSLPGTFGAGCMSYFRLALRSSGGTQVTDSVSWTATGSKWMKPSNTTTGLLPAGNYAYNARCGVLVCRGWWPELPAGHTRSILEWPVDLVTRLSRGGHVTVFSPGQLNQWTKM